ncbi:MAG: hypothetical protein H0X02_01375 [Nitrosomonas sp.]|nr:hypothetical protein [Nitrosomonas sp.]
MKRKAQLNKKSPKKRKRQVTPQKKREGRIYLKVSDAETVILPNGQKILQMRSKDFHYEIGYKNDVGKFKTDFRSLSLCGTWLDELRDYGHFCFVDTNTVNCSLPGFSGMMHVTGCYIFQMTQLEINNIDNYISWNRDEKIFIYNFFLIMKLKDVQKRTAGYLQLNR